MNRVYGVARWVLYSLYNNVASGRNVRWLTVFSLPSPARKLCSFTQCRSRALFECRNPQLNRSPFRLRNGSLLSNLLFDTSWPFAGDISSSCASREGFACPSDFLAGGGWLYSNLCMDCRLLASASARSCRSLLMLRFAK